MAALVTLATLRSRARLYANARPGGASQHVSDTDLNAIINDCLKELYDVLVAARGHDYYTTLTTSALSTIPGQVEYNMLTAIPTFYELQSIALIWSATDWEPMGDFSPGEEALYRSRAVWGRWSPKAYRLTSTKLTILPAPTTTTQLAIRYIPAFVEMTQDNETFDGVNGWDLLVTLNAAIAMRSLEQRETGDLEKRRDVQYARIESMAADRAASEPKRVQDVQPEGFPFGRRWPERLPRA